jgi:DNA-binding CsgD family transcriptional regulator
MPALDELPRRQRDIVDRLLRGERVPSIAASMYISPNTVRNHLSHVFTVFGVHSQSDLLALLRSRSDAVQVAGPEHRD